MNPRNINRLRQKIGFLIWGLGCVAANFLIDGYEGLGSFQDQALPVKFGAFLGLFSFITAAIFSGYLLLISVRSNSIQPALELLPWPSKDGKPSAIAFRATCVACVAVFLLFSSLFLRIILG